MSATVLSWVFFLAYVGAIVGVSVAARRKATGSMASFAVGTRTVSPVWVGLSLAVNMTIAATFVINPGLIYLYGWSGVLGYATSLFSLAFSSFSCCSRRSSALPSPASFFFQR